MKIGKIKNFNYHGKLFQVNTENENEVKEVKKMYEDFLLENYPEIVNLPKQLRTFSLEESEGRIVIRTIFVEEQELIIKLREKLEGELK